LSHEIKYVYGKKKYYKEIITNIMAHKIRRSGPTNSGEVGDILTLYLLLSPSLGSKAKLKSPCFFLKVAPFLQ